MGERLIELRDIAKSYGRVFAVGGVNFHVDRGEVVGLIGDNGAGKSTLIKMLAGAIQPTSGEILVRGKVETALERRALARRRHRDGVSGPRALRAANDRAQHLHGPRADAPGSACSIPAASAREAERLMREIGFTSKVFSPDSIVGQLSGGERQGVALARAIYNKADLIVMDEPTTALSLTETEKVFRFVRAVRAGGRSVLFIGHNIHHVFDIAERFVVMDRGTRRAAGDQGGGRHGRAADRVHGKARPSRRARLVRSGTRSGAAAMTPRSKPIDARAPPCRAPARTAPCGASSTPIARRSARFAVFVVMIGIFMAASPRVFLHWPIYNSVLVTLPVALCLVVPLVFVVTVGEIDLSFPATMGFSAWIFALVVHAGFSPFLGMLGASSTGMALGFCVGALVVIANLSSLIATLGMNYMLRGFIMIVTQGKSIALLELQDTTRGRAVLGRGLRLSRADFLGARLCRLRRAAVQPPSFRRARAAPSATIPTARGRWASTSAACASRPSCSWGSGAALAGVFSTMVNFTWWPTTGDGYLLPAIASVFVGGTPTWGGVGTIAGGAIGALDRLVHPERHRRGGTERLLCAVLQRPDHHPVAARPSVEPEAVSLTPI